MSARPPALIEARGAERRLEGDVVRIASSRDGRTLAAATADGDLALIPRATARDVETWRVLPAHDGAVLDLAPGCDDASLLSCGEDNRLIATTPDGETRVLRAGRRWLERLAVLPGQDGLIAVSEGRVVHLLTPEGGEVRTLDHASTVSAMAFDARGKRLACAHYNGASLWFARSANGSAKVLEWKGSHLHLALHPGGEALVTAMQEPDLHGWRLSDGHNMRMSGYPKPVESLSFSRTGRWLASSGADSCVLWPFFGGGPMGKPPRELAQRPGVICTRVLCHPALDVIAVGYEDGTLLLAEIESEKILPLRHGTGAPVTALGLTPDGGMLAFGTQDGMVGVIDLSPAA